VSGSWTTRATRTTSDALTTAVARAPRGPGVYVFLGPRRELLYIGKARDLRRRLADHARTVSRATTRTKDVRWIECEDEAQALCLEADLVVSLSPPHNASMSGDAYEYISLQVVSGRKSSHSDRDRPQTPDCVATLTLTRTPNGGRVYGGFPHLGKGKASWPAVRSKAGYSALLRLLWVTYEGPRIPSRLHGDSPPVTHSARVGDVRALRDFLSGRSRRLLASLTAAPDAAPGFMRTQLRKDLDAAEQFYWLGPCRARILRRRHGLRSPVDEHTFRRAVTKDLQDAIGAFILD
jgi:hypothetical protein